MGPSPDTFTPRYLDDPFSGDTEPSIRYNFPMKTEPFIQTVAGPVHASRAGLTLPHEHIIVDFIGAEETGPHRWNPDEVKRVMRPYLDEVKALGVETFVDCAPMFLGRDPGIFLDLSRETGLNILTNTGQYKEPFLPRRTFEIDARELADDWIREWEEGIGDSGIKPGFVKTAVEASALGPVNRKVIEAAGLTSKATGLTVATHTGVVRSAAEVLDILEGVGVDPAKWIFVHAQNEEDMRALTTFASRGSWIELDGLGPESAGRHMRSLKALLDAGFENRILLSHDRGWYRVGEPGGGEVKPYTYLFTDFIPMMEREGIDRQTVDRITAENPGRAYAIGS